MLNMYLLQRKKDWFAGCVICVIGTVILKLALINSSVSMASIAMNPYKFNGARKNFTKHIENIIMILQSLQENSDRKYNKSDLDMGLRFLSSLDKASDSEWAPLFNKERPDSKEGNFFFQTKDVWRTDKLDWRDHFYPGAVYTGEVCGETLVRERDTYPDWPYFKLKDDCVKKSASMTSTVTTILLNFFFYESDTFQKVQNILKEIREIYPHIKIVIAVPEKLPVKMETNVTVMRISNGVSAGKIWNDLVKQVKTPYTFIGRDLLHFDSDSQLERLIREISPLKIPIIGGAIKTPYDGHWFNGCHQMAHRNFTLVYKAGYKHSAHDCLYCDEILGPFIGNTTFLQNMKFDEKIYEGMLFHDFFFKTFKTQLKAVSCPDVMFLVRHNVVSSSQNREQWLPMVFSNSLNKVVTVEGKTFTYTCKESNVDGMLKSGFGNAPCKLHMLADKIKFVMKKCREHNILCALNAGTAVGALKVHSVLPWEKDADILYYHANCSALENLNSEYRKAGYTLNPGKRGTISDGKIFHPGGSSWKIDLYPFIEDWTEKLKFKGEQMTKILLDGDWVEVPRNIGRHVWDRYGPEIYKHVQHSSELNRKQFTVKTGYKWTGHFTKCSRPGSHDCLDQYAADGNLQFSDHVP